MKRLPGYSGLSLVDLQARSPGPSAASTLLAGLRAYWQLGEAAGAARNDSVFSSHLADNNGVTQEAGKSGNAAGFAGVNQYLNCASNAHLSLGGTDWTIDGWVWLDGFAPVYTDGGFLAKNDASVGLEYSIGLFNNGDALYQLHLAVRKADNSGTDEVYRVVGTGASPPALGTWHHFRAYHDSVNNLIGVDWDNSGSPTTAAHAGGTREAGAFLHVGTIVHNSGRLTGRLDEVAIWDRLLTPDEINTRAGGGAGAFYPFSPPASPPLPVAYRVDNTGGAAPIVLGMPLPLWLGPGDINWSRVNADGSDLRVQLAGGGAVLTTWVERIDRGHGYALLRFASPAVAASNAVAVEVVYGDSGASAMPGAYDALFHPAAADGNTVALFPLDEGSGAAAASTVGGYSLALTGAPAWGSGSGGNFRLRSPVQQFASGSFLRLNGSSQYGTAAGLLDNPPAAGCVALWCRIDSYPFPLAPCTIFEKVNAEALGLVTEGLRCWWDSASGQKALVLTMTTGGNAYEARLDLGGLGNPIPWFHVVYSWGSRLRIWVNGIPFATFAHAGTWGNGAARAAILGASNVGGLLADYVPFSFAELEVRNAEPSRDDCLRWFSRGGPSLSAYEYAAWQPVGGGPAIVTPTLPAEQGAVYEPRVIRRAAGDWYGVYSGGVADSAIFGMTSADGVAWTKRGPVMGQGSGGHAGVAARGGLFTDTGGTLYLTFVDAHAEGANLCYATTTDNGLSWTKQGVLMAPDATHVGWANHYCVKAGAVYHWLCEYRAVGGIWLVQYRTSPAFTGPYTDVDSTALLATVQQGVGNIASRWFGLVNGQYHYFPHIGHLANLPGQFVHYRSPNLLAWEPVAGGDPVIDMAKTNALPLLGGEPPQDQYADSHLVYDPDLDRVNFYCDADSNAGGGIHSAVCLFVRPGNFAVLDSEYPQVRPV